MKNSEYTALDLLRADFRKRGDELFDKGKAAHSRGEYESANVDYYKASIYYKCSGDLARVLLEFIGK